MFFNTRRQSVTHVPVRREIRSSCLLLYRAFLQRHGLGDQLAFFQLDGHAAVVANLSGQQFARERGFDLALQEALERARAIDRVVTLAGDVFFRRVAEFEFDVRSASRTRSRLSCNPTIRLISESVSGLNRTISSTRFKNSGRKFARSSFMTFLRTGSAISPLSLAFSMRCGLPMFEVMILRHTGEIVGAARFFHFRASQFERLAQFPDQPCSAAG